MPDSKITALASIGTGTDPANDPLVIVDTSDFSMAGTGTTKKVTLNNLLACSPTATLASATITGDLTVDTSTLKVDSANNRVGIVNASPAAALDIVGGKDSTNTIIGAPLSTVGGGAFANYSELLFKNTSGANSDASIRSYGNVWNAAGSQLAFFTSNNSAVTERYRIDNTGISTWYVGGSTAMTLNSTGLGVGDTPASNTRLTIAAASRLADTTGQAYIRSTDAQAADIGAQLTLGGLFNASSHYAFAGIAGRKENGTSGNVAGYLDFLTTTSGGSLTSRMRIDSSGNVGVGVTPSAWGGNTAIQLKSSASSIGGAIFQGANGGANANGFAYNCYFDGTNWQYIFGTSHPATRYQQSQGIHSWFTAAAGTGAISTFTQAMTLDASGNLLVGTTSSSETSSVGHKINTSLTAPWLATVGSASTNSNVTSSVYSTGAAAYRFYVGYGGTVFATNTTISAISDARLKENVQDIDVGLGAILALKPRKFDWKAGKGKDIKGDRGFIAQEFEQVFPQLVDEWKDNAPEGEAPYKSVRQDLIPVLVKAIQELTARVEALEA